MYSRILVPVDGSTFSEQLIAPASKLAKATGATLTLLRVADKADEKEDARRYVDELAAGLGAQAICTLAPGSSVASVICEEARRVPSTLVAICSHGRSGALRAVFGSVAHEVLRCLGEPVVVFRPESGHPAPTRIGRIVLPLDGGPTSESIIPQAAEFAKWLGARIVVVSVIDPSAQPDAGIAAGDIRESNYVQAQARQIAERYAMDPGWEVLHGDPKTAIPQFVRSLGDAMLAMTTHGRTGLSSVLSGSVMAQCLRDAGVPVFTRLP